MDYLPIFYRIKQRACLVVGGGSVASRKVSLLRKAGADVTVVSTELCDELEKLASSKAIRYLNRQYEKRDLDGCMLVIAATDQADVNEQCKSRYRQAAHRRCWPG